MLTSKIIVYNVQIGNLVLINRLLSCLKKYLINLFHQWSFKKFRISTSDFKCQVGITR